MTLSGHCLEWALTLEGHSPLALLWAWLRSKGHWYLLRSKGHSYPFRSQGHLYLVRSKGHSYLQRSKGHLFLARFAVYAAKGSVE